MMEPETVEGVIRTAENKKTDETTTPLSYMAIKVMIETGFKTNLLRGVR